METRRGARESKRSEAPEIKKAAWWSGSETGSEAKFDSVRGPIISQNRLSVGRLDLATRRPVRERKDGRSCRRVAWR